MSLLVPAYSGCPGSKAVKRSLLLYGYGICNITEENFSRENAKVLFSYVAYTISIPSQKY